MAQADEYPVHASAVILAALSFLCVLLDTPPLIWHCRNRNIAATSMVLWILVLNLCSFVNALIWPTDDILNWWPGHGLCDIEVRLFVGSSVALPGALACIMRGLANVLDTNALVIVPGRARRVRNLAFDAAFCIIIPVLMMVVYYVAQDKRYYVWGVSGCNQSVDYSWVGVVLVFLPAPVLMIVDVYYAILVVVRLHKYRRDFSRLLEMNDTNKSRFFRLFSMALVLILGILPVEIFVFVVNINVDLHPYSWSRVHGENWGKITFVTNHGQVIFDRWIRIASGILVFIFFGMGSDASKMYRSWLFKFGISRCLPGLKRKGRQSPARRPSWLASVFSGKAKGLVRNVSWSNNLSTVSSTRHLVRLPTDTTEMDSPKKESFFKKLFGRHYQRGSASTELPCVEPTTTQSATFPSSDDRSYKELAHKMNE